MRAVRPMPSPAVLLSGWTAGVAEVSRFSCMKFIGVSGVCDYAGLKQELALTLLLMLPTANVKDGGVRNDLYEAEYPPRLAPVYASLSPSRYQRKTRGRADR